MNWVGLYLAQYTATGQLDATFGFGGVLTAPSGGIIQGSQTATDGLIYATINEGDDVAFIRYSKDGKLDMTFAGDTVGDTLIGGDGDGDDTLVSGVAVSSLVGGSGDDAYFINNSGTVINDTAGTDTVYTTANFDLSKFNSIENLVFANGIGGASLIGNSLANSIVGDDSNDTINGGTGADAMVGGAGNDLYIVDNAGDTIEEDFDTLVGGIDTVSVTVSYTLGGGLENLTLGGTASISGDGNSLDNLIIGNSANNLLFGDDGNDTLNGGAGRDTMDGGAGNDYYVVDMVTQDMVIDSDGIDTVEARISGYTLAASVENLVLGTGIALGIGNSLNNSLFGNSVANTLRGEDGNDTLDGGAGIDSLIGGFGDDYLIVDNVGDKVFEIAGQGIDTVEARVSGYTLANGVENLVLFGNVASGTGNSLDNSITGNSAANTLNGGTGADAMVGGAGNDLYIVDNAGDTIEEDFDTLVGGIDTVSVTVSYTLGGGLENLTLGGTASISGDGNSLDNLIIGNSANNLLFGDDGNDTLNGGAGRDTMDGGAGNDYYVVDMVTQDMVIDSDGIDTVEARISGYTLAASVENLVLGTGIALGIGNSLNNSLFGNSVANTLRGEDGNDTLDGGAGIDSLIGGFGDDYLIVDNVGDKVFEIAGQGIDTVEARVSGYTLANGVENLVLFGNVASGTGNSLDNSITGNSAANTLNGGIGADYLDGGLGNDSLAGGDGEDTLIAAGSSYGVGQRDTLTGGNGNDVFILADENGSFYDDGLASSMGTADFAFISDFNSAQDSLVLSGSASDYTLVNGIPVGVTGLAGPGFYGLFRELGSTDELVAVLKSANTTTLNNANTISNAQFLSMDSSV